MKWLIDKLSAIGADRWMHFGASEITQVAQGISEVGILAISASAFVLLGIALMVACFLWLRSIVTNIIGGNEKDIKELLEVTKEQNRKLATISEGLQPTTIARARLIGEAIITVTKWEVWRSVQRVREENHIDDREATHAKIERIVSNFHRKMGIKLDEHHYAGRRLSSYMGNDWVVRVCSVFEGELYHIDGPNEERTYTSISAIYTALDMEFYSNLIKS